MISNRILSSAALVAVAVAILVAGVLSAGTRTAMVAEPAAAVADERAATGAELTANASEVAAPSPLMRDEPATTPGEYSPHSPHWQHIRTMATDFRVHHLRAVERPPEWDFMARHYDWIMSGTRSEYRRRNPTIKHLPYTLYLTTLLRNPDGTKHESLASLERWYASNPRYRLEDAFLHNDDGTRKTTHIWSSDRYIMNPGDPGYRAFIVERWKDLMGAGTRDEADGVFIDEHERENISRAHPSREFPERAALDTAIVGALRHFRSQLPGKTIQINTTEYQGDDMLAMIRAAGATHLEMVNNPERVMPDRWVWVDQIISAGAVPQLVGTNWKDADWDRRLARGNYRSGSERARIFELASYYMISTRNPDATLFTNMNGFDQPASAMWYDAIQVDIGLPTAVRRLVHDGRDPLEQRARVFTRDFERALIVVRPMAYWGDTQFGDDTAVDFALPSGTWYPIDRHGNPGAAVQSLRLRNGEAAILLKQVRQ